MKDKIIVYMLIVLIFLCLGIFAVLGVRDYTQVQSEMNRGPAVYNIKRVESESGFQKYNIINEDDQIIAILNLQLEDFQHDFQ